MADVLQKTTQEYNDITEIMSEIYYIEEWSDCTFPINIKAIEKNQQKDSILLDKLKKGEYKSGSFHE